MHSGIYLINAIDTFLNSELLCLYEMHPNHVLLNMYFLPFLLNFKMQKRI